MKNIPERKAKVEYDENIAEAKDEVKQVEVEVEKKETEKLKVNIRESKFKFKFEEKIAI